MRKMLSAGTAMQDNNELTCRDLLNCEFTATRPNTKWFGTSLLLYPPAKDERRMDVSDGSPGRGVRDALAANW